MYLNSYVFKIIILFLFSLINFYLYYAVFPGHSEFSMSVFNVFGFKIPFDKSFFYFLLFFILFYLFYRLEQFIFNKSKKVIFTPFKIFLYFLLFLFLTCFAYFELESIKNTFLLFSKILYFSFFPIILFFILIGFGKKISKFLPEINTFSENTKFLLSLNLGFFIFLFLVTIFSFFGLYNLIMIFSILSLFIVFGFREILFLLKSFFKKEIIFDRDHGFGLKLFSVEIFMIISFFLFSVGLITIIRPFPVGWDDLGVYMNFPNILANSAGFASFQEMYSWQIFTGIGYLFSEPAFAFFLNFSGYFFSFLTLNLIFSDLLNSKENEKNSDNYLSSEESQNFSKIEKTDSNFLQEQSEQKSFLSLPIILSTLFLGLPMSIFHSIKDMKLDQAIFFITSFIVFFTYRYLENIYQKRKVSLVYIFIIGLLTGFAFSIKFTSLFLVIGVSALLSFFYLGFLGLLGCLFLFFSIFTAGNLWAMMNVVINQDLKISLLFFVFGILLFGLGAYFRILKEEKQFNRFLLLEEGQRENQQGQKIEIELQKRNREFKIKEKNLQNNTQKFEKSENTLQVSFGDLLIILKNFLKNILVFFIGIFISLLPWFIKNTIYIYPNFSISGLLKGKDEGFKPDLKDIFSKEEIKIKNEIKQEQRKKEVVTQNEDLKRYLGYESGILPYTNMFWNISMQVNQGGKFTEISFLFFALIPLIFIFLPFKNKYFSIFIIIFVFFQLVFLSNPSVTVHKNYPLDNISKDSIEKIFSKTRSGDYVFVYKDIKKLENSLEKNAQKQEILQIWKQNRTYLQNLRDILASISLPFGYFVMFLFFMIPLFAIHYFLKKDEKNFIFRLNLVFSTVYIFFWCISSFSIVWYGITMYFCLLFMIGFCGQIISKQNKNTENQRFYGSLVFMIIIISFLIFTSVPHSISNLKSKNYLDYKTWKKSAIEDTFDLHYLYDKIFFELNIKDEKKEEFLKKFIPKNSFSSEVGIGEIIKELKIKAKNGDLEAKNSLKNIYFSILYPGEYFQNPEKIYRIGTFFKYYISENQKRVFEDGLIFYFNDYIYDQNKEKTWQNLKNLGFKYLLIDLGAATIDDSENHGLTKRYEKLLKSFSAKNLEIIETDSVCLRFATDLYKKNQDDDLFFKISSVSYDSYDENGKRIGRKTKQKDCAKQIEAFLDETEDLKGFSYIKKYKDKDYEQINKELPKSTYVVYNIR